MVTDCRFTVARSALELQVEAVTEVLYLEAELTNIELPGDFWCSGGIYGVNVTTLAGRWLCQINISYKSTDAHYS